MSDDQFDPFERDLRAVVRRHDPGRAPIRLGVRVSAIPMATPVEAPRWFVRSGPVLAAAAVVVLLAGAVLFFSSRSASGPTGPGSTSSAPTSSAAPSLATSSASASAYQLRQPNLGAIAFYDATRGLMVGGASGGQRDPQGPGMVLSTANGGSSWSETILPAASGLPTLKSVAVVGPSLAWAGSFCAVEPDDQCPPKLLFSSDGGASWAAIATGRFASLSFVDSLHGWAVVLPTPGASESAELKSTADGGKTWSGAGDVCPIGQWPMDATFVSATSGWLACGAPSSPLTDKTVLGTTDAGRTWRVLAQATHEGRAVTGSIPPAGYIARIAMRPDGPGLILQPDGEIFRTSDAGVTWVRLTLPRVTVQTAVAAFLVDDRTWLLAIEDDSGALQLLRTEDGGSTWATIFTIPSTQR